jgi:hypothetical protein
VVKVDLHPDHFQGVWEIVCAGNSSLENQKELVFDIEKLPIKVARDLERYVKSKISSSNKNVKKKVVKKPSNIYPKDDLAPKSYNPSSQVLYD